MVDGYLVGTGVGYEVDSVERHGSSAQMGATLLRHERFNTAGLSLVHVTPAEYWTDPAPFLDRLSREVARRAAAGLSEPPGLLVQPRGPVILRRRRDPRGIRGADAPSGRPWIPRGSCAGAIAAE